MGDNLELDSQVDTPQGLFTLLSSAFAGAIVSTVCNLLVLGSYFFILWYRPPTVNRVSLRLIVFSSFCNVIFCVVGIPTPLILDTNRACRVLIYILVVTDTMSTMCLAMVGLNLVIIFIGQVNRPGRLEKYYYAFIACSGVLATVIPLAVAMAPATPEGTTCWYHYYFTGRLQRTFKWMWYYGWLLLAIVLAAVCAALAINKFRHKQNYFVGSLNMTGSAELGGAGQQQEHPDRNAPSRAVVFRKVVLRCVGYPLIPLICKIWGVGIQIAVIEEAPVPFAIFVMDQLFSNLLGFFVSLVYFSDPSVIAVTHELALQLRKRYVDDYFAVDIRSVNGNDDSGTNGTAAQSSGKDGSGNISFHPKSDGAAFMGKGPQQPTPLYSPSITSQQSFIGGDYSGALMEWMRRTPESEISNGDTLDTVMVGALMSSSEIVPAPTRRSTYPQLPLEINGKAATAAGPRGKRPAPEHRAQYRKMQLSDTIALRQGNGGLAPDHLRPEHRRGSFELGSLLSCFSSDTSNVSGSRDGKAKTRKRKRSVPMHRVTEPTDASTSPWSLGSIDQGKSTGEGGGRKRASIANSLWQSIESTNSIAEPYRHPRFAMMMHWFLISVCRVKPPKEEEEYVMVDITSNARMHNRRSLAASLSETLNATSKLHRQQRQEGWRNSAIAAAHPILFNETIQDTISPVEFPGEQKQASSSEMIQPGNVVKATTSRWGLSERQKGKAPMRMTMSREGSESPESRNTDQPEGAVVPPAQPTGHFVLTVTDTTDSRQQRHEVLAPEHVDLPDAQPSPLHPRPNLLERISEPAADVRGVRHLDKQKQKPLDTLADMPTAADGGRGSGSGGARSILQQVWGRGAPPTSRSIKMARQFAEKMGDGASVIRLKQQQQQQQPRNIERTHALSPSPSLSTTPSQSPSSYISSGSDILYPVHLSARPRSREPVAAPPRLSQERVHKQHCVLQDVPRFLAADFGRLQTGHQEVCSWHDRQQQEQEQEQEQEYTRRLEDRRKDRQASQQLALSQHRAMTIGFSFGVTRSIHVGNWDHHDRVVIVEEQWDIDALIQQFIDACPYSLHK